MLRELLVDQKSLIIIKKYAEDKQIRENQKAGNQEIEVEFILLLREKETNSTFPIWIDQFGSAMITLVLENISVPIVDLFRDTLVGWEIMVSKVVIAKLEDETFFADIYCRRGEEEKIFNSRPSDAIALALHYGSPIFIEESLLAQILGDEETTEAMVFIEKNRPPLQQTDDYVDTGD